MVSTMIKIGASAICKYLGIIGIETKIFLTKAPLTCDREMPQDIYKRLSENSEKFHHHSFSKHCRYLGLH